jgi:succinyl-CoA synthetase beta subunit
MDLLEHQGKALFRRYGIPVPSGRLWPEKPDWDGALVVKAQVPAGGRGKAGGIGFAADWQEATRIAGKMQGGSLNGRPVQAVYVEQRLDIHRELYVAMAVDRDRRSLTLLVSAEGGVDIEELPEDSMARIVIDPLLGLRDFHVAAALRGACCEKGERPAFVELVRSMHRLAIGEDAELVEINPLVITGGGDVIAADAKVVLDDNAAFRRKPLDEEVSPAHDSGRSLLEAEIAATGAVGVEVDPQGELVAVVSGAGLMMATLDLLCEQGLSVRCAVDLGGTVLAGGEVLARVFEAVGEAQPRVTFLNAFMQTALCDEFARMLLDAHRRKPLSGRIVVRLKGRNADTGRDLLAQQGFEVYEDLASAVQALVGSTDQGRVL